MDGARECAEGLLHFIEECPSKYHVIQKLAEEYEQKGFLRLEEGDEWNLKWGKNYYVTRNGAALIAFRLPKKKEGVKGFHLAAAHCDSPTFQIKEKPERAMERYVVLNTERYGGMLYSTWMDRPLSVAGRVAVWDEEAGRVAMKLLNVDKDLLVIPNLAIHMNRDANKGTELNPQVDLQPLYGCAGKPDGEWKNGGKGSFDELIANAAGVKAKDVLGHDLFLYVRDQGRFLGENGEMILSPRLDDLQCVYALSMAHSQAKTGSYVSLCAIFDNEEVGSGSIQGADSTFLWDVVSRMGEALSIKGGTLRAWIASGLMVSADNAHAVHPNHPEKADPTNRPYLNEGIVIKFNSAQKYTTDGMTAAAFREICASVNVPCQTYVNRSDVAGGSTLGNISTAHVSIPSVDVGLPQLAMHSAVETAGTQDTWYLCKAMKEYFSR